MSALIVAAVEDKLVVDLWVACGPKASFTSHSNCCQVANVVPNKFSCRYTGRLLGFGGLD